MVKSAMEYSLWTQQKRPMMTMPYLNYDKNTGTEKTIVIKMALDKDEALWVPTELFEAVPLERHM